MTTEEKLKFAKSVLRQYVEGMPKEEPEWGESRGWGNADDSEYYGYTIALWHDGVRAKEALERLE